MKKYNDVDVAVWVATAIMTYNSYIECSKNNCIDIEKLYFTQSEIRKKSNDICTKNVQNSRIQQRCNGDYDKSSYNYLKSKGNLRRVTYIGEFQGEKEYPQNLNMEDILVTIEGEKSIEEILGFLKNEYKEIIINSKENHLKDILDFLNEFSNTEYRNPDNEEDTEKKLVLENIQNKGSNIWQLFKEMCTQLEDDEYKKVISSSWLKGSNTEVRDYLWIELKKKNKKDFNSSISIFAEKKDYVTRFRVALEIKGKNSNEEDYIRHNRFLNYLDIEKDDFEYFVSRNKDLDLEELNKEEISKYIQDVKDRRVNKIQVGKTVDYDFVKDNNGEDVIKIMKDTINRLKKYYEIAVDEGEIAIDQIDLDKEKGIDMIQEKDVCKNTILYGPPGTGKTFNVAYKALEIVDYEKYKYIINDISKRDEVVREFNKLKEEGQIGFCTFHQSYSYEDFVEGLRSDGNGGFEPKDGIFKKICERASVKAQEGLPKYEFDENNIDVHKMSLGDTSIKEDNIIFDYCIENNCISLGYGRDIDYSNCKNLEDIRKVLKEDLPQAKDNDFNITAIYRFKDVIKVGDIIIISSGNLKVRAIAKVTGEYYYDSNTDIPYNHFRKVEWLYNNDELIDVNIILKETSSSFK